ncbi:MAG: 5'/3'-nucleotidase SurE [Vicingaceae bacterium]
MTEERLILIVNDDGVTAPGICALVEAMMPLGKVVVVAPDKPQSGMGHAITINSILTVKKTNINGVDAYAVSGTPVDCVKLAFDKVLPRKPDLVVSGINHGSNSSINVIYSGTMSAALEGAIEGVASIGFSLLDHSIDADFEASKNIAHKIAKNVLDNPSLGSICLNVNIPVGTQSTINGIKICRQANAYWKEEFDERKDPNGNTYYWLTGKFVNLDEGTDTDVWALDNNYVSVVPVHYDVTDYKQFDNLKNLFG